MRMRECFLMNEWMIEACQWSPFIMFWMDLNCSSIEDPGVLVSIANLGSVAINICLEILCMFCAVILGKLSTKSLNCVFLCYSHLWKGYHCLSTHPCCHWWCYFHCVYTILPSHCWPWLTSEHFTYYYLNPFCCCSTTIHHLYSCEFPQQLC